MPRRWQDLCYEEQLVVAKFALKQQPHNPEAVIKGILQLTDFNKSTSDILEQWIRNFRTEDKTAV